ncbi:PAS domain S-box protein [Methanoculleus sp. FWC-SCC1]|uniref:histidine kinase n=1 Tax=Methanoculleus frigidifontis TaxID=2584085 RepID=A0ABT8M669_9EURY|nr:PAS domain S-box protein [Methanoculleus sp. FWC-SCC1]MDN7023423.1 PAS domain S-box protein [Methanoculleus sp. FWC-SCC1]
MQISVLLVDDEPPLLDVTRLFLERGGKYAIVCASSAREALERLQGQHFDVIVSDYDMPEMSGIAFLQALRSQDDTTPFIIFTGKGRENVAIEALNSGADFYLEKGGDPRSIFAELQQMIHKASRRGWTEAALKASEERYRAVVESQTELITRFRPDGVILFVNEAYCRYFGKRCDEIVGHRFAPEVPAEERDHLRDYFASLTPDNPVSSIEHRIVMPDGSVRWQHWNDRAIFDAAGRLIEYQSVGRDVTKRKTAEEALIQSERRLSTIIDHLPEATFAIDTGSRVISWNKAIEEMTGVAAAEIVGRGEYAYALPFYGERRPMLIDLVLLPDQDGLGRYRMIRQEAGLLVAESAEPLPELDGRILWGKATPLYDGDGAVIGAIESIRDITEMKRAEKEREELIAEIETRKRLLDTIFDVTPVQFYVYDRDLRYLYACSKGAEERGLKPDDMIGKTWHDLGMPPEIMEPIERQLRTVFATGCHLQGEYTVPAITGDTEQVYELNPIYGQDGQVDAVVSTVIDITERKRAEEVLRQINRKLNLLNSVTRHDVHNQLTILLGYLDISREHSTDPLLLDYITKMEGAAKTIHRQIAFTTDYQDIGVQFPTWQNLQETFECALASLDAGRVQVSIRLDDLEIFADPLLEKVFYNLLDNALRHGDQVSRIRVYTRIDDDGLTIICEDDGNGLPADKKDSIFKRGFGNNTGYGLFLAREILSITDLFIKETGTPGAGARFEMYVPNGSYRHAGMHSPGKATSPAERDHAGSP